MSRANANQVSDSLIDRLVDGELDETERHVLLARFESEPGAWRRCALAFLEAQAWTHAFTSTADTDAFALDLATRSIEPGGAVSVARRPQSSVSQWFRRQGILAAGVLLAFASGWFASTVTRASGSGASPRQPLPLAEARQPTKPAQRISETNRPPISRDHPDPSRLAVGQPDEEDASWESEAPLVLSEAVRRQLERQGYRVEQRSGLLSMELADGQSLAVPVDEVELRYVGNRTY